MKKRYSLLFALALSMGLEAPVFTWADIVTSDNSDPIVLTANTTYTVQDGTGPFTFSGVISDDGNAFGITKDGAGTLVLSGANTYTGTTTVSAGTLQLPVTVATDALKGYTFAGPGTINLALTQSDTKVAANFASFTGTVQIANNNWSQSTKINTPGSSIFTNSAITVDILDQGQVFHTSNTACAYQIIGTGNRETRGAIRLGAGTIAGAVTLKGDASIGLEGGNVSGAISGTAAAEATQTLTLGTANSHSGGTFSGIISDGTGGGKLAINIDCGATPTFSAANIYSGGTTVTNGTLTLTKPARVAGTYTMAQNGTLSMAMDANTGEITDGMVFKGTGNVRLTPNASDVRIDAGDFSEFTGTIQLANNGSHKFFIGESVVNDKMNLTLEILSGATIYAVSEAVIQPNIRVSGTGNSENYGAIRLANATISGAVTLTGDATFGLENGTITGAISGSAATNVTQTLTLKKGYSGGTGDFTGVISNGSQGGKLKVLVADATVNLTNSSTFSELTITKGTVNANKAFDNDKQVGTLSASCNLTVGSEAGETALLKLAAKALGDHYGTVTVYNGGTIEMDGGDISIGNGKGITFVGGGAITGTGAFWLRGNDTGAQTFTVTGAGAEVSIGANMSLINNQSTLDVQSADSTLTFTKNIVQWDPTNKDSGLTTIGAGTVVFQGANTAEGALIIGKVNTDGTLINGGTVQVSAGTNSFSSYTINKGTLKTTGGSLGSGPIIVNEEGTVLYNQGGTVANNVSGAGQVIIDTNLDFNIGTADYSNFTGTLELKTNTRFYAASNNFGPTANNSTIKVRAGSEFWTDGNTAYYSKLDLAGDGTGAGGDGSPRGAIRIDGTSTFYGDVVLSADASICSCNNGETGNNGVFQGAVDVQGHNLTLGATIGTTGGVTFTGNISSSAENGKITVSSGDFYAKFGDSTNAAATAPTIQTISVPILNNNSTNTTTNGLIFQPGANRTVVMEQPISDNGFVKLGAGTLKVTGMGDFDEGMYIAAGTVEWTKSGTISQVIRGDASGTFKVSGADTTVVLSMANEVQNLLVESGTVNVTKAFVDSTDHGGIVGSCNLTVGSAAGETAVLNLNATKAAGDHSGAITIYKGGTLCIGGGDISLAGSNTIKFIGGGTIANTSGYMNFRGNGSHKIVVEGENAAATIASQVNFYDGSGTIDVQAATSSLTISGVLNKGHENLGFTKTGAGELILSAVNTINGTVTVSKGTLTLKNVDALKSTSSVVVSSGAILNLDELKDSETNANIPSLTINGGETVVPVSMTTDGILNSVNATVSGSASFGAGSRFVLDSLGESLDWQTVLSQPITLMSSPNEITGYENASVDSSLFLMSDVGERTYFTIALIGSDTEGYTLLAQGAVPEPSSWALLVLAALGIPALMRRRTAKHE